VGSLLFNLDPTHGWLPRVGGRLLFLFGLYAFGSWNATNWSRVLYKPNCWSGIQGVPDRLLTARSDGNLQLMALIFQVDNEGHARPKIRCDSCGGVIENYADGVAVLDTPSRKPGTVIEPIFQCAHCDQEAENTRPAQRSMPIDHFMLYVLNNIQLTPNALEEARRNLKAATTL
jgi:hypothetical protein